MSSVALVGIIQGRQGPLALVETPDRVGYILRPGDRIGDGTVLEIGLESVTFTVSRRPEEGPSRVVVRLRTD